ncbi:MAG: hypothetical protein ACLVAW_05680 [Eisenbergiella massiliensis]
MDKQKEVDYRREKLKSRIAWGIAIFFACIWLVVTLVPFIFMIMNSFRKQFDMLAQGVFHLPDPWYFQNYGVMTRLFDIFPRDCCRFGTDVDYFSVCGISAFRTSPGLGHIMPGRQATFSSMHVTLIPFLK